jgi:hypothetical protein
MRPPARCVRRRIERRVAEPAKWNARTVTRALRAPLEVLCSGITSGDARVAALGHLAELIDEVPRSVLLSVAVRHNLGVRKYSKLVELVGGAAAVTA